MTADGHVALWHRDCWDLRDVPLPAADDAPPEDHASRASRRRGSARFAVGLAAATVAALAGTLLAAKLWPVSAGAAPPLAITAREPLAVRGALPARDDAPPPSSQQIVGKPIDANDEIPILDGKPLDELYPSLKSWVHPVTASLEYMPSFPPRLFGAERHGIEREECGAGHCGVDLDGPRGRPIVAVADGKVITAERRELGADGRSGRYVRIRHDDNTYTAYMHMDEVAEGLQHGSVVKRGQYLGTLGATAVFSAAPHLHFSLEIPASKDFSGDYIPTRYVNPSPFLMRSRIVPVIERPNRPALN